MPGSGPGSRRERRDFEGLRDCKGSEIMRRMFVFVLMICGTLPPVIGAAKPLADFEKSVVQMEITRKQYDFVQPWNRRVDQATKVGVVVGSKEILTSADFMSDLTLLRLQKNGRGKWFEAQLQWVD